MTPENARRRQTAHDAWLGQLTPEQRADVLARLDQELEASPVRRTRLNWLERARRRAEAEGGELPAWLVDHPDEGDGMAWAPDEPRESLQRAIDWRG